MFTVLRDLRCATVHFGFSRPAPELGLVFGAGFLISGVVVYAKGSQKSVIAAATTVAIAGLLQVVSHLR
jgi:hypothetical protein